MKAACFFVILMTQAIFSNGLTISGNKFSLKSQASVAESLSLTDIVNEAVFDNSMK